MKERWWGQFELAEGAAGRWQVGPATMRIEHRPDEWVVEHHIGADPLASGCCVEVPSERGLEEPGPSIRFASARTTSALVVRPALADRAIVARPTVPLVVPAGETVRLYVGSPVWLQLAWADRADTLLDLATFRPSDTWFGPSPVVGELCYATRTGARLRLDESASRPARVITAVTVDNSGEDALHIDRIKLPVPQLSLHAAANGQLWSQAMIFRRGEDDGQAEVRLSDGPPPEAGDTVAVAAARRGTEGNAFQRTLNALLG